MQAPQSIIDMMMFWKPRGGDKNLIVSPGQNVRQPGWLDRACGACGAFDRIGWPSEQIREFGSATHHMSAQPTCGRSGSDLIASHPAFILLFFF